MPASLSHRVHFSREASDTLLSSTARGNPSPLPSFPGAFGAVLAGSFLVGDPAFCSSVWSPAADPPPFCDEINPTFGRNPNEPDLTEC